MHFAHRAAPNLGLPELRRVLRTASHSTICGQVYGEYKGIPRNQVTEALARGTDVALRLDVQGAATVRKLYPDAVFLFLVSIALCCSAVNLSDGSRAAWQQSTRLAVPSPTVTDKAASLCRWLRVRRRWFSGLWSASLKLWCAHLATAAAQVCGTGKGGMCLHVH